MPTIKSTDRPKPVEKPKVKKVMPKNGAAIKQPSRPPRDPYGKGGQ